MTFDVDVIGVIYDVTPDMANPLPGWHVNTLPAHPDLEPWRVYPTALRRVFAGREADTACYRFTDAAEWDRVREAFHISG